MFKVHTALDSLYISIFQEAFDSDGPEDGPKICSVLGAIVLAENPLSPSAIAMLLDFDSKKVLSLLSPMHPLLIFKESVDHPVWLFHKSFPNFIMYPARCTKWSFHISFPDHYLKLTIGCLELMTKGLENNMCRLPDAVANSGVEDLQRRVELYINHTLLYACKS